MDLLHTLTLSDVARENGRSRPNVTAIVDGLRRLSYEELDARVDQVAGAMSSSGVGSGDRVMWIGRNSFRILECLLAAARLGAVLCPVNWRQTTEELAFIVEDFAPAVVVWERGDGPDLASDLAGASRPGARWLQADDDADYEAWIASSERAPSDLEVDPASACLALYTAAFSGKPSAALLSHSAILSHNLGLALMRQIEPGFTYLNSGPLFHVGTMMFCTATFHLGGTNVFMPAFDPVEACRLIEAERCQAMLLFPPMPDQIADANKDGQYDLTSLRASSGSDAWNAMITLDQTPWGRALGGYGQSEVAGMLTFGGLGIGADGSHGRPSPLVQLRIVDPDGNELPREEVGEITARGLHVMTGYHNRPEFNAAKQRGGWHHTGDLGRREKDGSISFIGPKLRMIKSGGENVYPAEVEGCLRTHVGVADCAVIGIPDKKWGQVVAAIIARADGAEFSQDELIEHCRHHIAGYKKPRRVVFVDSVPRRGFTPDYDQLDEQFGGGGYPIY